MAKRSITTFEEEEKDISTFQSNDLNNSQYMEHQIYNSRKVICSTICPELEEGEGASNIENNDVGSSSLNGEYVNEGLELWNRRRERWIRGNIDNSGSSSNRNNPALANITPNNYHSIYDSLIHEKKKLAKPVPLPYVIKILVSGWKRDGVIPKDQPSGPPSGPNNRTTSH